MQTSVGEWLEITICVLDALLHTREVVKNDLNVESNAVTEHIASLLHKEEGLVHNINEPLPRKVILKILTTQIRDPNDVIEVTL
jgi:hypothetical protein